jgi:hypothetical protein
MRLKFNEDGVIPSFGISLSAGRALECNSIKKLGEDAFVQIDTKLNLIEGLDINGEKTGNVYNKHMIAGYFFKIPKTREPIELVFNVETEVDLSSHNPQILYDFYYF